MKSISLTGAAVAALIFAGFSVAEEPRDERKRHGPPKVAVEACAAAIEGDTCSFEGRRGDMLTGTCATVPDKALACRPEDGRPGLRRRDEDRGQDGESENPE